MLLCRAAPLHIQCLVLVNDDDEVEEEEGNDTMADTIGDDDERVEDATH